MFSCGRVLGKRTGLLRVESEDGQRYELAVRNRLANLAHPDPCVGQSSS